MAKKTVASLQKKGAKAFTKAVKLVKSKNGSYSFIIVRGVYSVK